MLHGVPPGPVRLAGPREAKIGALVPCAQGKRRTGFCAITPESHRKNVTLRYSLIVTWKSRLAQHAHRDTGPCPAQENETRSPRPRYRMSSKIAFLGPMRADCIANSYNFVTGGHILFRTSVRTPHSTR